MWVGSHTSQLPQHQHRKRETKGSAFLSLPQQAIRFTSTGDGEGMKEEKQWVTMGGKLNLSYLLVTRDKGIDQRSCVISAQLAVSHLPSLIAPAVQIKLSRHLRTLSGISIQCKLNVRLRDSSECKHCLGGVGEPCWGSSPLKGRYRGQLGWKAWRKPGWIWCIKPLWRSNGDSALVCMQRPERKHTEMEALAFGCH